MAHTGAELVRIDWDSAVSIETACSGLTLDPYRSSQRLSHPVDISSRAPANQ